MIYTREKDFQAAVLQVARMRGWMSAHFGSTVKIVKRGTGYKTIGDRGASGFPDLVLVRRDRVMFVELKLDKGVVSEAQHLWLDALEAAGQTCFIWRPRDWDFINAALA